MKLTINNIGDTGNIAVDIVGWVVMLVATLIIGLIKKRNNYHK